MLHSLNVLFWKANICGLNQGLVIFIMQNLYC